MPVDVSPSRDGLAGDASALAARAEAALVALALPEDAELSVLLCDDAFIRPLNLEWRAVDAATDVLSFPQFEFDAPGELPEGEPPILGDIVISVETAARQAAEVGTDLDHELTVLLVHGLCHLLGYDHEDPADEPAMRAREDAVLTALGVDRAGGLIARSAPLR